MQSRPCHVLDRIVLITEDEHSAKRITEAFEPQSHGLCATLTLSRSLLKHIAKAKPNFIIVCVENAEDALLESLSIISKSKPIPILMYCNHIDPIVLRRSLTCGISHHVVGGFDSELLTPNIEIAVAQFERNKQLIHRQAEASVEVQKRRKIEQAKYKLMTAMSISEEEAYVYMRSEAMNRSISLFGLAEQLLAQE